MKKKKLHLMLAIFSLVVFCATTLMFMGCVWAYITDPNYRAFQDEEDRENAWRRDAEEQASIIKEEQAEEAAGAEEEENPISNEPITYNGYITGIPITLTVNFRTTKVIGTIDNPVEGYPDFIISDGKIDLDTFKVIADFSGLREIESDGNEIPFNGTITGKVSEDLKTFTGELLDNDMGESVEFTATTE